MKMINRCAALLTLSLAAILAAPLAHAAALSDYLESVGRPAPADVAEVSTMIRSITLVSAVKN